MTHRLLGKSSTRKEVRKWQLPLRELIGGPAAPPGSNWNEDDCCIGNWGAGDHPLPAAPTRKPPGSQVPFWGGRLLSLALVRAQLIIFCKLFPDFVPRIGSADGGLFDFKQQAIAEHCQQSPVLITLNGFPYPPARSKPRRIAQSGRRPAARGRTCGERTHPAASRQRTG